MRTILGALLLGLPLITALAAAVAQSGNSAFAAAWQRYVEQTITTPRQPDCVPRLYAANSRLDRRGAVLMFHGFGGCPQQLFELAERVSDAGFDVVLPLSPGHGLNPTADGTEDLSRVPEGESWPRYAEFTARMNDIMAKSSGTRVAVGFSLGGTMALHAALRAPAQYERVLLLAPMLEIRGGALVGGAVEVLGRIPGVRDLVVKPFGIRDDCHRWQAAGRGGFCDYRLEHSLALVEFADRNADLLAENRLVMPIQIVGAGDEKYVSNGALRELYQQQQDSGPIELCFLPDDVPHEMLTPYENVGRDMDWLEGLLQKLERFVVAGDVIPGYSGNGNEAPAKPGCGL